MWYRKVGNLSPTCFLIHLHKYDHSNAPTTSQRLSSNFPHYLHLLCFMRIISMSYRWALFFIITKLLEFRTSLILYFERIERLLGQLWLIIWNQLIYITINLDFAFWSSRLPHLVLSIALVFYGQLKLALRRPHFQYWVAWNIKVWLFFRV